MLKRTKQFASSCMVCSRHVKNSLLSQWFHSCCLHPLWAEHAVSHKCIPSHMSCAFLLLDIWKTVQEQDAPINVHVSRRVPATQDLELQLHFSMNLSLKSHYEITCITEISDLLHILCTAIHTWLLLLKYHKSYIQKLRKKGKYFW